MLITAERDGYLSKHKEYIDGGVNLVEINLIRQSFVRGAAR